MIISKDNHGNWTPVATGNGTFIGTLVAFNVIKDTLPVILVLVCVWQAIFEDE